MSYLNRPILELPNHVQLAHFFSKSRMFGPDNENCELPLMMFTFDTLYTRRGVISEKSSCRTMIGKPPTSQKQYFSYYT